jgi:hypothetical protein
MEVIPLAFDSFGARSMCTAIRTKDVSIVIDPGVALGPKRYGLPPHRLETKRMAELWEDIKREVKISEIVVVTHYHYDHHNPESTELLDGKKILLKHPKEKINKSQMARASYFINKLNAEIEFADGKEYEFGNTLIRFSNPVFHGASPKLGFVIEVFIDDGKGSFSFSSDVEGPIYKDQTEFLVKSNAEIVFVDGPMTYMLGYRFSNKSLESSVENLKKLIESTDVKMLILDHHLTRDLSYMDRIKRVIEFGDALGVKVMTAAEYSGREVNLLEALRKKLYDEDKQ